MPDEDLKLINRYLLDYYGQTEGKAHFRLIWVDKDYRELRKVTHTKEGLQLLYPEVQEVIKYPHINLRYVLERLTIIPEFIETDLVEKISYEPVWTFERYDDRRNLIPIVPNFGACKFVCEVVLEAIRTGGRGAKYHDPESTPEEAKEAKEARINGLMGDLFGDENAITDALSLRQGVAYGPGSSPNSSTPAIKIEK
jgi:hypothetical protein